MDQLDVQTKIGLVVVSASSVSELRYPKAAPPGVAFLTSRMMLAPGESIGALREMESNASRAVGELASAKVDSVAYCCTVSGALRGMEGDRQFCQELESEWDTPITSTMLAVAEALQHLGLKKIVVTTPYPDSHHVAERAYLKEAGIEALTMQGMGFETADGFASVSPQEIFDFAMNAWKDHSNEADGLFISCMNHDGMAAAQALEDEIGKPVVTSHTATLWRVLSQAGETKPLLGYGRLLAETRPDLRRK
jgi:maleate isomerase